jgi:hypothetical protein
MRVEVAMGVEVAVEVGVLEVKPAVVAAEVGALQVAGALGSTRIVPGPWGVSDVRQIAPASSTRYVGSPLPRPCTPSVTRTSIAKGARQSSSSTGSAIRSTHEPHAKAPDRPEPGNPTRQRVPRTVNGLVILPSDRRYRAVTWRWTTAPTGPAILASRVAGLEKAVTVKVTVSSS